MITNSNDYEELLWQLQTNAPVQKAVLLPKDEQIYDINLNTRKVSIPEYLSVKNDHQAETIYFKVDRYFENIDLVNTGCIIKYINAEGDGFIYPVPFYDLENAADEKKIVFPWCIQGQATKKAGTVKFSICFYKINENHKISYSLNTLVAEGKILQGQSEDIDNLGIWETLNSYEDYSSLKQYYYRDLEDDKVKPYDVSQVTEEQLRQDINDKKLLKFTAYMDIALDNNILELVQELKQAKQDGLLSLYWIDV